jgi:hypothetical protein
LTWNQRPLLPPPAREEVCMENFVITGNIGQQVIYMEEEIEGEVIIAKLNYDGIQIYPIAKSSPVYVRKLKFKIVYSSSSSAYLCPHCEA